MRVTVVIATSGDEAWTDLAWARAYPSADRCRIGDPSWTTEVIMRHLPAGTVAESRNAAAADADGDWLCFLDADDELAPGYLTEMEKARERLPLDGWHVLVPSVQYVVEGAGGPYEYPPAIPNGGGLRPLLDINHAVIGSLVPRRLFLAVGGFRELAALEDWDLWLRCEEAGAEFAQVPRAVYRAWRRSGSRNHDQSLYQTLRAEALARRSGR